MESYTLSCLIMKKNIEFYKAAKVICDAWRNNYTIQEIPLDIRPTSISDGYKIQNELAEILGVEVVGRKIAATSLAGQKHIGVESPLQGLLFREFFLSDGGVIPCKVLHMACAEPEFAFLIGDNLDDRGKKYVEEEVIDATEAMYIALEFPETRLSDFINAGPGQLLADNACAGYFVLGPEVSSWRKKNLSEVKVEGFSDGKLYSKGSGKDAYGGPLKALTWLANDAAQRGAPLRRGEIITTGTCTAPIPIFSGVEIEGKFEGLGKVVAYVSEK